MDAQPRCLPSQDYRPPHDANLDVERCLKHRDRFPERLAPERRREAEPGKRAVAQYEVTVEPAVQLGEHLWQRRPLERETTLVDDERRVRETLAEMLTAMGHSVLLAESGQHALETLAENNCKLVFTDLAMPEMDGWETAREIRKRWPDMNVVLVTGYGTGTVPPGGEDNLVNGIIGKPFDFAQIGQTIMSIVANQPALENVGA